jgi:hypothetical protein
VAQIKVEFELTRDAKGYRVIDGEEAKNMPVVAALLNHANPGKPPWIARVGGKLVRIGPLNKFETLYKIFAERARTPEGAVNFIRTYGSLTLAGQNSIGDSIPFVINDAKLMYELLSAAAGGKKKLLQLLGGKRTRISRIEVDLGADLLTEELELQLSVHSLIDGLWLQAGQAVASGANLRQCQYCHELFETGPGSGRRLDAKFCSDEHRIAFNSHKRSEGT